MIVFILFFISYSLSAFLISNIWVLCGFSIFNLFLMLIFKINAWKALSNLFKISIFALFVFLFNLIFDDVISSAVVAWKILIVANFAFTFSSVFGPTQIATGLGQLLFPLKIFKVNTDNLVIMIVIALNFIPIIMQEIKSLNANLKARNVRLNFKTIFTKSHVILTLYFASLIKKTEELETALLSRSFKA